jgi:DNA replication and repair protein RecF
LSFDQQAGLDGLNMHLRRVTLQHYRNVASANLNLHGRQTFLLGPNGQGKTNLLEAIGFMTALRSFRATDNRVLIAHGQVEAALGFEVDHEQQGNTRVGLKLRPGGKEVWVEETRVTRLADFLGQFPTVVFSSQDQQLIRGAPGGRRRWLDLTLAATDQRYLFALQAYHRALADRNQLLKRGASDGEIMAFERPLATQGAELMQARHAGLQDLAQAVTAAYAQISDAAEAVAFAYAPDLPAASGEAALLQRFAEQRGRDRALRTTGAGPHRDDFEFTLGERAAKDVASEGQQRTLVLALRLAQADYFLRCGRVQPVLLADDVLGELDPERRRRFWNAIPATAQVVATGTALPEAALGQWQIFDVSGGGFRERGPR